MTTSTAPGVIAGGPGRDTRLAALDGLRLIAALLVVAYHYTYRAPGPWGQPTPDVFPTASSVTAYGWLGVQLFFIISGFVICMSAWERDVRRFAVSRATRLLPAYWFAVFATTITVAALDPVRRIPPPGQLIANLTMLQTPLGVPSIDGVYWTLWAELHFYLLFAVVVWRGLTRRRVVAFCLAWTMLSAVAATTGSSALIFLTGADTSPFFAAGVALFLIYRCGSGLALWGIVAASWGLGIWRLQATVSAVDTLGGRELQWPVVVLVLTVIFAIMGAVALRWTARIRGRWLTVAGALTYPLYLLHQEIGYAVIASLRDRMPAWSLLLGLVSGMLVVARLVHLLIERPATALVRRWSSREPALSGKSVPCPTLIAGTRQGS